MTEKQELFLDYLFGEAKGDVSKAKIAAGYSEGYSNKKLVDALGKEIEKRTRQFIAVNGPKAVFSLLGVLDGTETLGVKDKIAAAKDFLDRAGFKPTDKVEVEAKTPLFILPSKEDKDASE